MSTSEYNTSDASVPQRSRAHRLFRVTRVTQRIAQHLTLYAVFGPAIWIAAVVLLAEMPLDSLLTGIWGLQNRWTAANMYDAVIGNEMLAAAIVLTSIFPGLVLVLLAIFVVPGQRPLKRRRVQTTRHAILASAKNLVDATLGLSLFAVFFAAPAMTIVGIAAHYVWPQIRDYATVDPSYADQATAWHLSPSLMWIFAPFDTIIFARWDFGDVVPTLAWLALAIASFVLAALLPRKPKPAKQHSRWNIAARLFKRKTNSRAQSEQSTTPTH